jgi:RNA-binding protein 26
MAMGIGAYAGQLAAMGMNGMNGMVGMGGMMNGRRPQGYQPPDQKRGICRDYHSQYLSLLLRGFSHPSCR